MGCWAMVYVAGSDGKGLVDDKTKIVVGVGSGRLAGCTCIGEGWDIGGDGGNRRR